MCSTTKRQTALTNRTNAGVNGTTLLRQYISDPMHAQTIGTGTAKGTVRCSESGTNDNILQITCSIRVCSNDGGTFRAAQILAKGQYGPSNEWATDATGLTNRRIADGDATGAVTALEGDRLVIELGYSVASGSSISGSENFGDNAASDCADDESGTGANNPFIELSVNILFVSVTMAAVLVSELTGTAPMRSLEVVASGSAPTSMEQT
jgi:hypothetical protein